MKRVVGAPVLTTPSVCIALVMLACVACGGDGSENNGTVGNGSTPSSSTSNNIRPNNTAPDNAGQRDARVPGVHIVSGAGALESPSYKARISVGAPVPTGTTGSPNYTITLGPPVAQEIP